jgi:hypothetical protein
VAFEYKDVRKSSACGVRGSRQRFAIGREASVSTILPFADLPSNVMFVVPPERLGGTMLF